MGDWKFVFSLQQKFLSFSKRPDRLCVHLLLLLRECKKKFSVGKAHHERSWPLELHVLLKIRMPEATVCTVLYAFRVWGLMKLKNKVISSPVFFFWRTLNAIKTSSLLVEGCWKSSVVFQHIRTRSKKCGYPHFPLVFSKTVKLPQKFAEHNPF